MKIRLSLFFTAFCLPMAQGAYTYFDATPSNTTLNGTTLDDRNVAGGADNYFNQSTPPNGVGNGTDGFWTFATTTGYENGNYFQSDSASHANDAENTAPLVTTINLATVGTYDIVALFTRTSSRDIAAKIGSAPGSGDIFTTGNAWNASQTKVPLDIDFDSSYTDARGANNAGAAFLGQFTTTVPNQAVQIYINGFEGTTGTQDERTQYDGIGFQLVPEPGSSLLGLLGSVLLLRRRR